MACRQRVVSAMGLLSSQRFSTNAIGFRPLSSTSKTAEPDIEAMLSTPSWSVKSLFDSPTTSPAPAITQKQLHHLLRLSALPLPTSAAQEERMIADLQSQLKFVQAIQSVDTTGVKPLQSIRDETKEAEWKNEITVATLQADFDKEETVGKRGRIRRKPDVPEPQMIEETENWNPLEQASRKVGKFFVVDTAKD